MSSAEEDGPGLMVALIIVLGFILGFCCGCEEYLNLSNEKSDAPAPVNGVKVTAGDNAHVEKVDSDGDPIEVTVGDDSYVGPVNSGGESQRCPIHGVNPEACKNLAH